MRNVIGLNPIKYSIEAKHDADKGLESDGILSTVRKHKQQAARADRYALGDFFVGQND